MNAFYNTRPLAFFHPVAGTPDGFNIDRMRRIGLNFFPDAVDVDHDRRRIAFGIVAPNLFKKTLAAKDDALIASQKDEEFKILMRQRELLYKMK